MSKYSVQISADTKAATKSLKGLDKQIDSVTKNRSLNFKLPSYKQFEKQIENIQDAAEEAANNVKLFYRVAKNTPVVGGKLRKIETGIEAIGETAARTTNAIAENNSATKVMGNVATATGNKFGKLLDKFAKLTIVMYGVREVTSLVGRTFGGFFNETIGRAAKFEQTLLKTKTTLASTNRVFVDGGEILDPLQKINALSGEIGDRVESIRQRSIDLAGVTSNDVVEVFGMVASQISQINGNLADAEDLAIQFAAALGTFGIPLYQARQEIGSILRGDITVDSYLAKALGITNEDITRAKSETEGVVGFLEKRLAAAVAGQTLAAKGLTGVLSNIRDIYELIAQAIGEPLLDPIIQSSTALYNILFQSKDVLMDIGRGLGSIISKAVGAVQGAFLMGGEAATQSIGTNPILKTFTDEIPVAIGVLKQDIDGVANLFEATFGRIGSAIRSLFKSVAALSQTAIKAVRELIEAFIQISLLKFESLTSAFATILQGITPILQALTSFINIWADILRLPIVQYFAQIAVTFAVLKATGLIAITAIITQLAIWALNIKVIRTKVAEVARVIQKSFKSVARLLSSIIRLLAIASAKLRSFLGQSGVGSKTLKELEKVEIELTKAANAAKGAEFKFRTLKTATKTLGKSLGVFLLNLIKNNAAILITTTAVTVLIDQFGRWKRAQEEARISNRDLALFEQYGELAGKLGRELSTAEKELKTLAEKQAQINFDRSEDKISEYTRKIKELNDELKERQAKYRSFQGSNPGTRDRRVNLLKDEIKKEEEARTKERKLQESALSVIRKVEGKKEIETQANKRKGLEKEIINIRRQFEGDLFRQQQTLRSKEIELFRKQQAIIIQQIEIRNKKLLEGEEGASRAAIEAFNKYIEQKKQGELNLETQKKQLAVDVLNLERTALEYRWATEKKIAELRKRTQQNEVAAADAAAKAATGKVGGGGKATFGETGLEKSGGYNAAGQVHGHFQTNKGTQQDLINDVRPVIKALAAQGTKMELMNGEVLDNAVALTGAIGDLAIDNFVRRGMAQHNHSGDGRSFDLSVPKGTRVPLPLKDVRDDGGRGGVEGTLPGSGLSFVSHLTKDSKSGMNPIQPEMQSLDIPDAGVQSAAYEQALNRVNQVKQAIQDLSTESELIKNENLRNTLFDTIFPIPKIEEAESQLKLLKETLKTTLSQGGKPLTGTQSLILERDKQIADLKREIEQAKQGVLKNKYAEPMDRSSAIDELSTREKEIENAIKTQFENKIDVLNAQEAINTATGLAVQQEQLMSELGELQLRAYLQLEGATEAQIALEVRKFRITEQFNKLIEASPKQADVLTAALKRQLKVIDEIGRMQKDNNDPVNQLMKQYKDNISDTRRQIASLASTVTTELGGALSSAISGLIDGTTSVQEAFSRMFENIGKAFIDMATQMLAQKAILMLLSAFGGGSSGLSSGMGGMFDLSGGGGMFTPGGSLGSFGFADGGRPAPNKLAVIGEDGPELWVPDSAGTIISNKDAFGAARGAMSGAASGNSNKEEGASTSAATTAFAQNTNSIVTANNLIRERETRREETASFNSAIEKTKEATIGGGGSMIIETQVINNVEYASIDQVQKASALAIKQARAQVFSDMKNRPSIRRQIGVG